MRLIYLHYTAVPDALFNELAERIPEDRLRGVKEIYVHFWRKQYQIQAAVPFLTISAP
jgi:hypothetical protein